MSNCVPFKQRPDIKHSCLDSKLFLLQIPEPAAHLPLLNKGITTPGGRKRTVGPQGRLMLKLWKEEAGSRPMLGQELRVFLERHRATHFATTRHKELIRAFQDYMTVFRPLGIVRSVNLAKEAV